MAVVLDVLDKKAKPKKRAEVNVAGLECLTVNTAYILFAVAEAVLGENFLQKAPKFIETVDDYLNYQRKSQREAFLLALLLTESPDLNFLFTGKRRGFSHMSIGDRRKVLENLRGSKLQQQRNLYAAFVNVSASTFYASELTWPDIQYEGVSVDHPEILNGPPPPVRWRPRDKRPVEP